MLNFILIFTNFDLKLVKTIQKGVFMFKKFAEWALFCFYLSFLIQCTNPVSKNGENNRPIVVSTTGMIADVVSQVGGEQIEVIGLMGPGVDPHLYKATQRDLSLLREASMVFYNGLHLEGKMGEVLESFSREKPVFAIGDGIDKSYLISVDEQTGSMDPHIWFDVSLWASTIDIVVEKLKSHFPEHANNFQMRADAYRDSLKNLHAWVHEQVSSIPTESRIMITAHDAFSYFGKAYQMEVKGLQGISTVAEFGLKDRRDLVNLIVSQKIKSVFVETSVSSKSLEAVISDCKQRGWEVKIGGTLYSDAMGRAETPEGTYMGMVRANVRTIVAGLK